MFKAVSPGIDWLWIDMLYLEKNPRFCNLYMSVPVKVIVADSVKTEIFGVFQCYTLHGEDCSIYVKKKRIGF